MKNFGLVHSPGVRYVDAESQENALRILADLAQGASVDPLVRNTAVRIVTPVLVAGAARTPTTDKRELDAVFDTVKYGNPDIAPFVSGLRYVADSRFADYFESPIDVINNCVRGACASDCDGHAALIAALLGSIGWKVGLRAYGVPGRGFSHVYAVVAFPKKPPCTKVLGLDTTVPESSVGWEPPKGDVLTAWLE